MHSSSGQPSCSHLESLSHSLMNSASLPSSIRKSAAAVHRAFLLVGGMSPCGSPEWLPSAVYLRQTRCPRAKEIEADEVQVTHLLHEFAVILGVLLERMHVREGRRCDEGVPGRAEVRDRLGAGAARIVGDEHVFLDELDVPGLLEGAPVGRFGHGLLLRKRADRTTRSSAATGVPPGPRLAAWAIRRSDRRSADIDPRGASAMIGTAPRGAGPRLARDGRAPLSSRGLAISHPGWSPPMSPVSDLTSSVASPGAVPAIRPRRRRLIDPVPRGRDTRSGWAASVGWILGVAVLGVAWLFPETGWSAGLGWLSALLIAYALRCGRAYLAAYGAGVVGHAIGFH